jgi:hypothetical protein
MAEANRDLSARRDAAASAGRPEPAAEGFVSPSLEAGPEQLRYADVLEKGMLLGLLALLLTYFLYVTGIVAPYVPLDKLAHYWRGEVGHYLHDAGIATGWNWVKMIGYGDFLNFVGIAFLAGVTIACYASIVPLLIRRRDRTYAVLAIVQIVVLSIAASGILGGGGH